MPGNAIGVLPVHDIVTQLAHVAALQNVTIAELSALDDDGWARLAGIALGLEQTDMRQAVIDRHQQNIRAGQ